MAVIEFKPDAAEAIVRLGRASDNLRTIPLNDLINVTVATEDDKIINVFEAMAFIAKNLAEISEYMCAEYKRGKDEV